MLDAIRWIATARVTLSNIPDEAQERDSLEGGIIFNDPYSCSVVDLRVVQVTDTHTSGCNDGVDTPKHLDRSRKSLRHGYFRRHIALEADNLQRVEFQMFASSGDLREPPSRKDAQIVKPYLQIRRVLPPLSALRTALGLGGRWRRTLYIISQGLAIARFQ
jgi:hypothetical protein